MSHKNEQDHAMWSDLFQYSLEKAKGLDQLSEELGAIAPTYGREPGPVPGKHIKRWISGERLFPLWARQTVLHFAKEQGWAPKTKDQAASCYSLWLKAYPGATVDQFASDFNIHPESEILKFT